MLHDQAIAALPYGRVISSHASSVQVVEGILWITDDGASDVLVHAGETHHASGHMVIEALESARVIFAAHAEASPGRASETTLQAA
ncbi:hypothetical protein IGB42_01619 [Andreprevotia sp. IGB-42]|uniref:hypothetical protein n=1 Tax=Andreprevotia sp. IGB-42 TaxID=2497473 RepID=UPI0013590F53|nr:hypothetical protein [Andreprevotia sp. IGB-42]KAF0813940.1 hypothetical protein IGB42_01619 [Andreprevotia sp. IGB-42]